MIVYFKKKEEIERKKKFEDLNFLKNSPDFIKLKSFYF